jgi:hypothetical protein
LRLEKSNNINIIKKLNRIKNINNNIDNIIKIFINNKTIKDISKEYNCTPQTIKKILLQSNNKKVYDILNRIDINIDLCKEYLKDNITMKKLAEKYNCTFGIIKYRLKNSNNELVLQKLKNNFYTNPSDIYVKDKEIIVISNNTENKFVFDYSEKLFNLLYGHAWNENIFGYLFSTIKKKLVQAHWLVIGKPPKNINFNRIVVDHIDNNPKNNKKLNLRIVTNSINCHNRGHLFKNNTSGFTGVSFINNIWQSRIQINNKRFNLGNYKTKEEAGLAYLNTKYNLLGFEYMSDFEIEQYNKLLTYFTKDLKS